MYRIFDFNVIDIASQKLYGIDFIANQFPVFLKREHLKFIPGYHFFIPAFFYGHHIDFIQFPANKGNIRIDDTDIREATLFDLRGLMGNVNQEAILFNDTFFNNIAFGVEGATMEQVEEAARIANAHDFIIASEKGYDTNIGDRGGKLSGGQRQRISIARAILKNPPILILDEATSALDTESERLVQEALENLMKNRTTVVIAHRLSTIRNADEICVMHEGEIVERGKHEELLALDGYYKRLCDMQSF